MRSTQKGSVPIYESAALTAELRAPPYLGHRTAKELAAHPPLAVNDDKSF